jgi:Zn-dependent metalloprotease
VPAGASAASVARAFLGRYGGSFGIADQARELRVTASDGASVRFQQLQRGVPVLGGELVVNIDSAGNVRSANGETLPATRISTVLRIDEAAARSTDVSAIAKYHGVPASALEAAPPELWIYDSRLVGGAGLDRPSSCGAPR